ncbi:MAG: hypothetical protein ACRDMZ_10060, partial [Solirubrobacteraceae bacterium]
VFLVAFLSFVAPAINGHAMGHGGSWQSSSWHGGGGWHGGGTHVFVGVAPVWGFGWGPGWWYPPSYYYAPPLVVQQPPPQYVERPSPTPSGDWYYCPSARGYYPSVPSCPQPWVMIPPTPQ